jgi:hypothetical protein
LAESAGFNVLVMVDKNILIPAEPNLQKHCRDCAGCPHEPAERCAAIGPGVSESLAVDSAWGDCECAVMTARDGVKVVRSDWLLVRYSCESGECQYTGTDKEGDRICGHYCCESGNRGVSHDYHPASTPYRTSRICCDLPSNACNGVQGMLLRYDGGMLSQVMPDFLS